MRIEKLVVIGVGLIGGSLALALKRRGVVGEIVGLGRRVETLEEAVSLGVIDRFDTDHSAVQGADLIFMGVPVGAMATQFERIAPYINDRTTITDGGSTKQHVIDDARQILAGGASRFVPGHPIAGSERSGVAAANAALFDKHTVLLTPLPENDPSIIEQVTRMWQYTGACVETMDPVKHDRILGLTSHLPHILAYTLVDFIARGDNAERCFDLAAGGFFDFTRIASSDPIMWRDITVTNRESLSESIGDFIERLSALKELVDQERADEIESLYRFAREARNRLVDKRKS
ncbi:MAG: hypothetical protein DHS20C01_15470 [marine bacterium B5-7]|nr:MAG: hypothetical protein DHS20C01_15470 [marine bacterium B5-7]